MARYGWVLSDAQWENIRRFLSKPPPRPRGLCHQLRTANRWKAQFKIPSVPKDLVSIEGFTPRMWEQEGHWERERGTQIESRGISCTLNPASNTSKTCRLINPAFSSDLLPVSWV